MRLEPSHCATVLLTISSHSCIIMMKGTNGIYIAAVNISCTSYDNTICPENQIITDTVRRAFLDGHNQRRSQLMNGQVRMVNNVAARPGSKMRRLTYGCAEERSAHSSAQARCNGGSSPGNNDENSHVISGNNVGQENAARTASSTWWSEISRGRMLQKDEERNKYSSSLGIPNFANMAWDTHEKLGCAIVTCNSNTNVVCHYSPKSSGEGLQIYKMGPICKRCHDYPGTYCSEGLCTL
ncbi:hypothetical protein Y032_0067g31 [Ancylostoma ceylanicum]|uniref:SCP domain-containing protein n=1 Tax=Ancylostoma ceylanicum TaxID=53326 RepID=A0A016TZG9_9BILA|nr:hypothetical protein Y032_0067g31 [Ancylostoma ceylanicum]